MGGRRGEKGGVVIYRVYIDSERGRAFLSGVFFLGGGIDWIGLAGRLAG